MNHYPILFISLGPGDPELITLKGWKALQAADIVFCPETEGRNGERTSRAANIVQRLGVGDDHIRRFLLPMSKRREAALQAYDGVYAEARALQDEGLHVCIVAEGDAGFYSSVHYVFERLRADGRAAEHVAGIPAFIAAGALAGLHTARTAGGRRRNGGHHEAVAMRRRSAPLHGPASRVHVPLLRERRYGDGVLHVRRGGGSCAALPLLLADDCTRVTKRT